MRRTPRFGRGGNAWLTINSANAAAGGDQSAIIARSA
jgi:hypothetical protein